MSTTFALLPSAAAAAAPASVDATNVRLVSFAAVVCVADYADGLP